MNAKLSRPAIDVDMAENPAMTAFETWMSINKPVVAALSDFNGRMIEQMAKANNEWLGFVSRRLSEDMVTSRRLLECKTLQDVFATYSDFMQRAQQQYQAEFQYFTRLNQQFAEETASAVKSSLVEANTELRH